MAPRLELQSLLKTILGNDNVYFQPPANFQMQYPCIVYQRDSAVNQYADNGPFHHTKRYQVTIMTTDPDSEIPDKVAALPLCEFSQYFVTENIHHDVYDIFF
jgi:hypothetical protein